MLTADDTIEQVTADKSAHYEPYGWHHWPQYPWFSYQLRRGLGETQEGGGGVSEVLRTASRIVAGDLESWHHEWLAVAERNRQRGLSEEAAGHVRTAMNCYLRAANHYRQAEFFLEPTDPRRLKTFELMESCSHRFLANLNPSGEVVDIPFEDGKPICGYFVRAPFPGDRLPVLICMGGLDSIKDEMWFMQAHGCLQRGISVLMIDGPGQGGTLRRHGIVSRPDTEVPIAACIDWLVARSDVDPSRIAVCGSSMGGYYAARAGCYEPRLAAAISHGAVYDVHEMWGQKDENFGLAMHIKWVLGAKTMDEAHGIMKNFTLEGHLDHMKCPFLIVHGGHDVLTVAQASRAHDYAKSKGVDVTLRIVDPEETGAEHCQHDHPTIGQELISDWLADRFGIDQRAVVKTGWNPLI
ncbi:S9 family peptidase [Beijerinckia sp. L45]|uniref:alpha/beta hydrolase family protein n=1 Tax=Beijerinckia sp. L45 TaxID=1641855 RepID=UPI00131D838A|nr:prolyl oligopeptidase family serine peptidase [Beijerinckia sp. L45]